MDPILVLYGSAGSRDAERRRLDRDLELRRVIRERAASAAAHARVERSADLPASARGILFRLRLRRA